MVYNVLGLLLICHFVADYYMQTSKIAKHKAGSYYYTSIHCALYAIPFGVLCVICRLDFQITALSLIAVITHFMIDILKCRLGKSPQTGSGKGLYILDQILHIWIIGGSTSWLINHNEITFHMEYVKGSTQWVAVCLYMLIIMQPSYISYKLLFSKRPKVEGLQNRDNYGYKAVALVLGGVIWLKSGIGLVGILCFCIVYVFKKHRDMYQEALRMLIFVTAFNVLAAGAVYYYLIKAVIL